jgi:lipase ATG15
MIKLLLLLLCPVTKTRVFRLEKIVRSVYSDASQKVGLRAFDFKSLPVSEQMDFSVEIPDKQLHFNDYTQELKLSPKDPAHVLALAKMTLNSYYEPSDSKWVPIPGWEVDYSFGWSSSGIRGYVFSSAEVQVIVIKGTSLSTPIGSGPTAAQDKYNDNMMFSCCCAKGGYHFLLKNRWEWTPICGCPLSSSICSVSCLLSQSNFDASYYNLAQTIYLAVKEWSPRVSIYMTGHSLGGALASLGTFYISTLVALTNKLPAFAFEAPGDLMYASRIGLLPELPAPGNEKPNYTDFLSSLEIYHFGNTDDPIYMGNFYTLK